MIGMPPHLGFNGRGQVVACIAKLEVADMKLWSRI
jgi:hypothetical protein